MKWIPIDKAKVKFKTPYLLIDENGVFSIGHLSETKQTDKGIEHKFETVSGVYPATHIAIITDPNKK